MCGLVSCLRTLLHGRVMRDDSLECWRVCLSVCVCVHVLPMAWMRHTVCCLSCLMTMVENLASALPCALFALCSSNHSISVPWYASKLQTHQGRRIVGFEIEFVLAEVLICVGDFCLQIAPGNFRSIGWKSELMQWANSLTNFYTSWVRHPSLLFSIECLWPSIYTTVYTPAFCMVHVQWNLDYLNFNYLNTQISEHFSSVLAWMHMLISNLDYPNFRLSEHFPGPS